MNTSFLIKIYLPFFYDNSFIFPKPFPSQELDTPISTSNVPSSTPVSCRSSRVRNTPAYLEQYHCNLLTSSPAQPRSMCTSGSNKVSTPYDLIKSLQYSKLSLSFSSFYLSVSTTFEPTHYYEAVKFEHWRKAMQAEIDALERIRLGNIEDY